MMNNKTVNTQKLVLLAILTAIVIALQIAAIVTRPLFPMFSITLVLVPIIIGAALIGLYAGAWLGLVFGFVVLISGDAGLFLAVNPAGTVVIVLLKGALAGFVAGLLYRLLAERSKMLGAIAAAVACPIINTGIFIIGCYVFFLPLITEWAGGTNVTTFIFLGMIGANFLIELAVNIILSPTIVRLIQFNQDRKTS